MHIPCTNKYIEVGYKYTLRIAVRIVYGRSTTVKSNMVARNAAAETGGKRVMKSEACKLERCIELENAHELFFFFLFHYII